jgi:hypothetical protein
VGRYALSQVSLLTRAPPHQNSRMSEKTRAPGFARRDLHIGAVSSCSSGIVPVDTDDATVLSPATRVVRCAVSRIVRGNAFRDFEIPRMCVRYKGLYSGLSVHVVGLGISSKVLIRSISKPQNVFKYPLSSAMVFFFFKILLKKFPAIKKL